LCSPDKAMKKHRIFFLFSKIILVGVLLTFIYWRFNRVDWTIERFAVQQPLYLCVAIVFVPINWFLEWRKWRITTRIIGVESNLNNERNAFMAGMIAGMLTPNMQGNFIGRIYYFERKHRVSLVIGTVISNYAQFLASVLFGVVSFFILGRWPFFTGVISFFWQVMFSILGLVAIFVYFNLDYLLALFRRKKRFIPLFSFRNRLVFKGKIGLLSILRHLVFTVQFACVLLAFGQVVTPSFVWWIWQFYFWVTLAPSLFFGKIAIRESIAIWVLGFAGMTEWIVFVSSFVIWIINLAIPTLFALFRVRVK
jgi:hypothetical protein